MPEYLSNDFHQNSKIYYDKNTPRSNPYPSTWPEAWKITYIKTYNRFPVIKLPEKLTIDTSLTTIINTRNTERFLVSNNVSLETIGSILYHSYGETDHSHKEGAGRRAVASGGARFPLEIYILTLNEVKGLSSGLYHYRPDIHSLEHIYDFTITPQEKERLFLYTWADDFSVAIFITAVFERSQMKYKERGYRHILLEAGAVSQAMQNASIGLNVSSVIFSGTYDDKIEELLGIDGVTESLVSSVIIR